MASAAFWLQSSTHTPSLLQQRLSKLCSAYSLLIKFYCAFILRLSSDPSMSAQQPRCLHCLLGHISLRKHFIFFSVSEKPASHPRALLLSWSPESITHAALPLPQQCTAPYPPDSSSSPVLSSPLVLSIHSTPLLASILGVVIFLFLYVCCGGGGALQRFTSNFCMSVLAHGVCSGQQRQRIVLSSPPPLFCLPILQGNGCRKPRLLK